MNQEDQSKIKRLFILGSGFSKAVSEKMPVVKQLTKDLEEEIERNSQLNLLNNQRYQHLRHDLELLLTYLSQEHPWKTPAEFHEDRALFLRISEWLAQRITECEASAFKEVIPEWPMNLVRWLNKTRTSVITFNYDTMLERICFRADNDGIHAYTYGISLPAIQDRVSAVESDHVLNPSAFHVIKLHGSINWFYSGGEQFPGEQIFQRYVATESPDLDSITENGQPMLSLKIWLKELLFDKVTLIIPPLAEKSRFYSNQMIRSLWIKAKEHLAQADEIYCVGYSLPDTDLTTKLLLQTACTGNSKKIFVVNLLCQEVNDEQGKPDEKKTKEVGQREKESLIRRYREAFPKAEIDTTFIKTIDEGRDAAVKAMTEFLCSQKEV
jgi:hypothetical protein